MTRRRYSAEFVQEALALVQTGRSVGEDELTSRQIVAPAPTARRQPTIAPLAKCPC